MKNCPYKIEPCDPDCALFEQVKRVEVDPKTKVGKVVLITPTCKKFGPVGPGVKPK